MSHSKQALADTMKMTWLMEGSVNGHAFTIEGEGTGKPYEGKQSGTFRVTKGGPLPFAFDIVAPTLKYGFKCFMKYPADIPDYFKLAFPEGLKYDRKITFEDGGCATATVEMSLKGNTLMHKTNFQGGNFPIDGPVMQKRTLGWEPTSEKMTPCDGIIKGDTMMYLMVEGGKTLKCRYENNYRANKPVLMPPSHFVDLRLTRTNLDKEGLAFKLEEYAVARVLEV
ncbi:GFP-like fluorescent chromoprotein amFP486 [Stylophora pistillata]|nr:GFP-like fluorescent chromoprotein amFP486 [Stylophora pistillata]